MNTDILSKLYNDIIGEPPARIVELPASGSNRRYFRLEGPQSIIGAIGTSREENEAFIYMAERFKEKGLPVPEVLAVSDDHMAYIQQDLGDLSLFQAIEKGRLTRSYGIEEKELIAKTLTLLPDIQFAGKDNFDYTKCYPSSSFDMRTIMWDLNYFKYCFLKATGLDFQEDRLEDDFVKMARVLMENDCSTFMYRDFQSRNVMIKDGNPWFIDFQGGRRGPFYYDVASFLWQAKANFPESLREEMIDVYIESLRKYVDVDRDQFFATLRHFVLFRTLQVLGAYGFRGYFEKKPHFMQSVPYAIANLRSLLTSDYPEYPYLESLLKKLVDMKQFTDELQKRTLTVRVMSFAYKKGIPNDTSGNGGGYVFDCRAVNNPGKYERFKPFTGLDKNVIKYLEDDGEILTFLDHCYALVDATVQRYKERGFTNLMVCFGCTGGRHRSVYCAQHMAEHLNREFNVKVELVHREQDIEQEFAPKDFVG
ncbi:MAG: phosphotransferase [Muribaculaceae bacterium]|nr:phosphotransferase [Muribaculaceae bacterium]MDE6810581.1 phosphotransferase [Muribaculaceae bacterium]